MKQLRHIYTLLILCSCVQSFEPKIDSSSNPPLVVDALLTNEEKIHEITISRAAGINGESLSQTISNAQVFIEDTNGQRVEYVFSNGKYLSENSFAGIVGNSYQLTILLDENVYESDFQEMLPPKEIETIKAEFGFVSRESETGEITTSPEVGFSVDILTNNSSPSYHRFDWNATFEATTPFQGQASCWSDRGLDPPPNLNASLDIKCYQTETSSSFLRIFSSEGLDSSINSIEVFSVDPHERFQSIYSPEILIYTLNETVYNFWEAIENQTTNAGGLFDSPPGPIIGNIKSLTTSSERVAGIFEVASVSKKRAFFRSAIIKTTLNHYGECTPMVEEGPPPARPFHCCICSQLPNVSTSKPEFWID